MDKKFQVLQLSNVRTFKLLTTFKSQTYINMDILKLGSQGDAVKSLQQQLIQLGYKLIPDGIFGSNTQETVIQFQHYHNLAADGIAGPVTMLKINTLLSSSPKVTGIDISHLNGSISWNTIGNEVSFVYCKASQGNTFKDPTLMSHFNKLSAEGIIRGAYHFLTFQNTTAEQQISNFLSCGVDFSAPGVLPPVLDIEWQVPDVLNAYILPNRATCIQLIADWLSGVAAKTGRTPIIYTNRTFWHTYLGNPSGFSNYPLWIAAYQPASPLLPPGWNEYTFWQNSGNGTINSIAGQVDLDVFNGNLEELKKLALM